MSDYTENEKLLLEYQKIYDEYNNIEENKLQREIVVFNIRIRLTLDMTINYQNNDYFIFIKDEKIKETYKNIFKLNEYWFAYEALLKWTELDNFTSKSTPKTNKIMKEKISELKIGEFIKNYSEELFSMIAKKLIDKTDLILFLDYLIANSDGTTIKNNLNSLKLKIKNNTEIELMEFLSIVYGIRNSYVHNGDTAKSGVKKYQTKIELTKLLQEFLIGLELKIALYLINKRIEKTE